MYIVVADVDLSINGFAAAVNVATAPDVNAPLNVALVPLNAPVRLVVPVTCSLNEALADPPIPTLLEESVSMAKGIVAYVASASAAVYAASLGFARNLVVTPDQWANIMG